MGDEEYSGGKRLGLHICVKKNRRRKKCVQVENVVLMWLRIKKGGLILSTTSKELLRLERKMA
jgi:hypothetical protein